MNKQQTKIICCFLAALSLSTALQAQETTVSRPVLTLIQSFLTSLKIPDETQAEKAIVPLVHASLLDSSAQTLKRDVREFSFRKAHNNAHNYALPPQIVRVKTYDQNSVSPEGRPEPGTLLDVFLTKKEGMPAPLKIFVPSEGKPVIYYMGSL